MQSIISFFSQSLSLFLPRINGKYPKQESFYQIHVFLPDLSIQFEWKIVFKRKKNEWINWHYRYRPFTESLFHTISLGDNGWNRPPNFDIKNYLINLCFRLSRRSLWLEWGKTPLAALCVCTQFERKATGDSFLIWLMTSLVCSNAKQTIIQYTFIQATSNRDYWWFIRNGFYSFSVVESKDRKKNWTFSVVNWSRRQNIKKEKELIRLITNLSWYDNGHGNNWQSLSSGVLRTDDPKFIFFFFSFETNHKLDRNKKNSK